MKAFIALSLLVLLAAGCATRSPHAEFVRTITFSSLQSFDYKHSFISGLDFRESEQMMLDGLSKEVMLAAFQEKGFEQVGEDPDFFIVVRWHKMVTTAPDIFDSIDGPRESLDRRESPSFRFASRLHLTVEAYETAGKSLFWRKELPNIFDATQLTEERVVESLRRAVANFPQRVERDPELMDIE